MCPEPKHLKHLISLFRESWDSTLGLLLVPSSFPLGGSVFLFASAGSFLSHFDFQVVLETEVYLAVAFLFNYLSTFIAM
jgi:hypothetical protein